MTTQRGERRGGVRLAVAPPCPAPTTGLDGVPPRSTGAEDIDRAARHADELAAIAERAARQSVRLFDALSAGRSLTAVQVAGYQHQALRVLASSLGELHTELDELGHLHRAGDAS